ncbi:uncharacterized protein LOC132722820 [Ruditapes philippinarum]|uniref:uncharacterized protein LOC132722820 n=1 Tax=Ruditapes philippinarum TaxID=129788 RepID=UPI00295BD22E|nr:uncharacterized protein LOC132722820 [Ruditapes philippinarum]
MKGIAGNLIFILIICQSLQLCVTNENTVFDNLNYNADEVQWVDAVNRCNENGATLVPFQPEPGSNGKNVTVVKRSVHFKFGNESWVGDYKTYDVIKGSEINLDIHVHKCVALHVTDESLLTNNNLMYGYDLVTKNCTSNLPAICSNDNNTFIKDENTLAEWIANRGCNLWEPEYKSKPVAENTSFASGHFTSPQINHKLIGNFYWVNYIVQEQYSKLPIAGNILQCGYINHTSTGVSYTDC